MGAIKLFSVSALISLLAVQLVSGAPDSSEALPPSPEYTLAPGNSHDDVVYLQSCSMSLYMPQTRDCWGNITVNYILGQILGGKTPELPVSPPVNKISDQCCKDILGIGKECYDRVIKFNTAQLMYGIQHEPELKDALVPKLEDVPSIMANEGHKIWNYCSSAVAAPAPATEIPF